MKTYCFDFDGTIADTFPLIVNTLNRLLKESGEKEIDSQIIEKARNEGVEKIIREINISPLKMLFLVRQTKIEMNKNISKTKTKKGIAEALEKISARGDTLGILSSNSRENVISFLKESKLPIFDFVSTAGFFNKSKVIKKLKKSKDNFIYIGDEVRDIRAGKAAGVSTIAVKWGLSSEKSLLRAKPDMIAKTPQDIASF